MRDDTLDKELFSKKCWKQLPKVFIAAVLLASVLPLSFSGYSAVRPQLVLIPVFYWIIFRPQSFSLLAVFFLGIVLDFLDNTPLGVNTLVMLGFFVLTASQRRFLTNKPFAFVWCGFGIICFCAFLSKWLIVSIGYARFLPFSLTFFSWLLLVLLYPFVAWFCAKIHVFLLEKEND